MVCAGSRFIPARAGNTETAPSSAGPPSVHPRSRGEHHQFGGETEPRIGSSPLARGTRASRRSRGRPFRFIPARAGNTRRPLSGNAFRPVHPRSRGEHLADGGGVLRQDGSSPLARGTRCDPRGRHRPLRFIPARAGNTAPTSPAASSVTVHPRSRGEHRDTPTWTGADTGSSPLARGTPSLRPLALLSSRFIPARAGNTMRPSTAPLSAPVHPRSRGEHRAHRIQEWDCLGSSPLARGTQARPPSPPTGSRFIPARAGNTAARTATSMRGPVHPRSRGEHSVHGGPVEYDDGSSPLARGTPPRAPRRRCGDRFIPARAGNTTGRTRGRTASSVHPRSRGEHARAWSRTSRRRGSSPLARGTRGRGLLRHRPDRFIPARAGNTAAGPPRSRRWPVHPRSRGEHPTPRARPSAGGGSSPLARGTRAGGEIHHPAGRFIPARAGNTSTRSPSWPATAVHPRSRGEHLSTETLCALPIGSSPLARGTPPGQVVAEHGDRFIPARAGNTDTPPPRARGGSVHPRSRGEHGWLIESAPAADGSSPLARGTRAPRPTGRARSRFIPARAGNTRRSTSWPTAPPVHPRSRGEHATSTALGRHVDGSSPLARGTRPARGRARHRHRFIPARAGNTGCTRTGAGSTTVHPRSRGEHRPRIRDERALDGSSPLARGTRDRRRPGRAPGRFIPARAGNTAPTSPAASSATVHPRSRGEHAWPAAWRRTSSGSSPLARGTPPGAAGDRDGRRFIPARAGNTRAMGTAYPRAPVHPRSRGEHDAIHVVGSVRYGSSPLARGTPPRRGRAGAAARFIPARAGNTGTRRPGPAPPPVHPRSRGEHITMTLGRIPVAGSSPLARGTRGPGPGRGHERRFIPARAGNTWRSPSGYVLTPVHPRSRGEHAVHRRHPDPALRFIPARAGNTRGGRCRCPPRPVHPRSRGEHDVRTPWPT